MKIHSVLEENNLVLRIGSSRNHFILYNEFFFLETSSINTIIYTVFYKTFKASLLTYIVKTRNKQQQQRQFFPPPFLKS